MKHELVDLNFEYVLVWWVVIWYDVIWGVVMTSYKGAVNYPEII